MQPVFDGILISFRGSEDRLHDRETFFLSLAGVAHLLALVGFDIRDICVLQQIGKQLDKLLLLSVRKPPPFGTKRTSRHLGEIKSGGNHAAQQIPPLNELALSFEVWVLKNRQHSVYNAANLVGWGPAVAARGRMNTNIEARIKKTATNLRSISPPQ